MNKNELADGVILSLGYNSQDKKLDRRLVWFWADRLIPALVEKISKEMGMGTEDTMTDFVTTKEAKVFYSERRQQYYTDIPTPTIEMPGYSKIRQIGDIQDEETAFVPVQNGQQAIIKHLEVGGLGGRIGYRIEGNRVFFVNMPNGVYETVLMKYVPTVAGLDDDEDVRLPATAEYQLINMIVAQLQEQKMTPEDKDVNSVDNK